MLHGGPPQRLHVRTLTIQVDRHDRLRPARDSCGDRFGVEVVGGGVDIDKDRPGSHADDRTGGGKEGERGGNHLIPGANVESHQGQHESIRPRGAADPESRIAVIGDLFFQ